ncbi:hypothetical protein COOONC_26445 [Cooperia oncophora]
MQVQVSRPVAISVRHLAKRKFQASATGLKRFRFGDMSTERTSTSTSSTRKDLKSALPPLPTPDKLYQDIVHCCSEVLYLVDLIDNLKEDISYFFDNNESWKILEREARIKELTVENYSLRLHLLRKQLSLFYSTVPVIISMNMISEKAWDSQMSTPSAVYDTHSWKEDSTLPKLHKSNRQQCHTTRAGTIAKMLSNKRICDSLKEIKEELDQLRGSLQDNRDGRVSESEQARIAENVEFMEGSVQEEQPQPPDEEKESIFEEIHHLEQELKQVHNKIRELAALRRCRPRQYEEGITREEETTMRCAFCFAEGQALFRFLPRSPDSGGEIGFTEKKETLYHLPGHRMRYGLFLPEIQQKMPSLP